MSDLEMVLLCAKAMGYSGVSRKGDHVHDISGRIVEGIYWPLENDAQAMGLVKKKGLEIEYFLRPVRWSVVPADISVCASENSDLNRAIVECVARVQKAKESLRKRVPA